MNFSLTFLLISLCLTCVCSKKIPPYITLCHQSQEGPNLKECINRAVEQVRVHMKNGISDLFIPPMNPLILPEAGLDSGDNFKASFKNIEVYYVDEFIVNDLNLKLDNIHLDLHVTFPKLRFKSQYNIDGRILILQLQGQGPADGNFTDVSARLSVDGKKYLKKGKEHISITNKNLELQLGKPVLHFENIFRDNQDLNDQTNKIINENIVDILDELMPVIKKTVIEVVFGVVERIFARFSFDELFPK